MHATLRTLLILLLTFVGILPGAALAADPAAAPPAPAAKAAPPRTAEDFFWALRTLKRGAPPEVVRGQLGPPARIEYESSEPGLTKQFWSYDVKALPEAAAEAEKEAAAQGGAPAGPVTRDVRVVMTQGISIPLEFDRATVFLAGNSGGFWRDPLNQAIREWKASETLRTLLAVVRWLPKGLPVPEISKLVGKPVDVFADATGSDPNRYATFFHEGDVTVVFKFVGESGARTFAGTNLNVIPK
jgi:hypothetical protein